MLKENTGQTKEKTIRHHITEMRAHAELASIEGQAFEEKARMVSCLDAARDTVVVMGGLFFLLGIEPFSMWHRVVCLISFAACWCLWRGARAALYSWSHLERVHRLAYEEKCAIVAHREQEREELLVLYGDKGFSGELLDKVVNVLMADHERLLRVMLEEEMGLQLKLVDHPLHVALSSLVGALIASIGVIGIVLLFPDTSGWVVLSILAGGISAYLARLERNSFVRAFVWATLSAAAVFQALFAFASLLKMEMP